MSQKWTLDSAAATRGPLLHPLAGANAKTLFRHLKNQHHLDSRSAVQRLIALGSTAIRFPFYHFENAFWKKAVESQKFEKPPIFVLGHWRSGTTHLHNLLSRDPQFGYLNFAETALPWNMLGKKAEMARSVMRLGVPKTRGMDNVRISLEEPQEEELALGNMSGIGFYNIYYFPQSMEEHARRALFFEGVSDSEKQLFEERYLHLAKKVSYAKEGRQLIFKNPPSTTRISMLKRLFPNAKFVHIVRNPFVVYCSTMAMFPRLFNAFSWQKFGNVDLHRFSLKIYREVMESYLQNRALISSGDLVETRYEDVAENPVGELERIYDQFEIEGKSEGLERIKRYLESVKSYQKNRHQISQRTVDEIREKWGFSLQAWNYPEAPPEDIEVA